MACDGIDYPVRYSASVPAPSPAPLSSPPRNAHGPANGGTASHTTVVIGDGSTTVSDDSGAEEGAGRLGGYAPSGYVATSVEEDLPLVTRDALSDV